MMRTTPSLIPNRDLLLSDEALEYLRKDGKEVSFPVGSTLFDPSHSDAFYVILEGRVELRYHAPDGTLLTVTHHNARESFGEIALIRNQPANGEIIATTPVRVLVYPKERFSEALRECKALNDYILAKLAHGVLDTRREAWLLYRRTQAMDRMITQHPDEGPIIAHSTAMKTCAELIQYWGKLRTPCVLLGDSGTGKSFLARKIHDVYCESIQNPQAPFVVLDCRKLEDHEGGKVLFGSPQHDGRFSADAGVGAIHLAEGGTLVLRHFEDLNRTLQERLFHFLEVSEITRIIATSTLPLDELVRDHQFHEGLALHLERFTLKIPPLRDRKPDILPLAHLFLKDRDAKKSFSIEAESLLFAQEYRQRNVIELREAVEMAALFTEDNTVTSAHIPFGPQDEHSLEVELTQKPFFKFLFSERSLQILRASILVAFVAIILAGLFRPNALGGNLANSVVWRFWEPLLILLFFYTGRLWCSTCPMSTGASWIQRVFNLNWTVPEWLKTVGPLFTTFALLGIIFTEHFFHMTETPYASALLLLVLFSGAILCGVLFKRQVWCRYLCPLGALGASFSPTSVLQLRATPGICTTYCKTHDCAKGNSKQEGCPVFHHPLTTKDGDICKFCFNCVRVCPHGSVKLYARPLLHSIWGLGSLNGTIAPFALSTFFFSIVMLVAFGGTWSPPPLILLALGLGSVGFGFALSKVLPFLFTHETERDPSFPARVASTWMILAWGPLMAYQLENVPILRGVQLRVEPSTILYRLTGPTPISLLLIFEFAFILVAALLTLISFHRVRARLLRLGTSLSARAWLIISGISLTYTLTALAITFSKIN